jgi:hypothetical protein
MPLASSLIAFFTLGFHGSYIGLERVNGSRKIYWSIFTMIPMWKSMKT